MSCSSIDDAAAVEAENLELLGDVAELDGGLDDISSSSRKTSVSEGPRPGEDDDGSAAKTQAQKKDAEVSSPPRAVVGKSVGAANSSSGGEHPKLAAKKSVYDDLNWAALEQDTKEDREEKKPSRSEEMESSASTPPADVADLDADDDVLIATDPGADGHGLDGVTSGLAGLAAPGGDDTYGNLKWAALDAPARGNETGPSLEAVWSRKPVAGSSAMPPPQAVVSEGVEVGNVRQPALIGQRTMMQRRTSSLTVVSDTEDW
jgi:hypothetical protein